MRPGYRLVLSLTLALCIAPGTRDAAAAVRNMTGKATRVAPAVPPGPGERGDSVVVIDGSILPPTPDLVNRTVRITKLLSEDEAGCSGELVGLPPSGGSLLPIEVVPNDPTQRTSALGPDVRLEMKRRPGNVTIFKLRVTRAFIATAPTCVVDGKTDLTTSLEFGHYEIDEHDMTVWVLDHEETFTLPWEYVTGAPDGDRLRFLRGGGSGGASIQADPVASIVVNQLTRENGVADEVELDGSRSSGRGSKLVRWSFRIENRDTGEPICDTICTVLPPPDPPVCFQQCTLKSATSRIVRLVPPGDWVASLFVTDERGVASRTVKRGFRVR